MNNTSTNNKRIAKNTIYLYFRMLFTLFVGLFTSRVVLNALGVHDYGLNNVVAGVISLLGYVSGLLNQGTSRFLTIGLGKGDIHKLKDLFTACFSLHLVIAVFTLLVGETAGLWFVNTQLVIDADRMFAANVVYQLALFSSMITFIQAPFQASIISHEKMGVFAYMSIYDVCMKLLVAFLLLYIDTDKLILYSCFYFCVNFSSVLLYNWYCRNHFEECSLKIGFDSEIYKEIGSYIGWNALGTFAYLANAQGFNILMNIFFTTVVNAAIGLTSYISGVINQFISNFQTAARPQIIKLCAQGSFEEMNNLIINTSKYSSYIILLMGIPVFLEAEFLVELWLGQVPEYVVPFIRLTIFQMVLTSLRFPLADGINAIGKMKIPNLFTIINYSLFLLLWYIALKANAKPVDVYVLAIFMHVVIFSFNIFILRRYSGISAKSIFINVFLRMLIIGGLSVIIPYYIHSVLGNELTRFMLVCSSSVAISLILIYFIGLNIKEKKKIVCIIQSKILKLKTCK